ncbi:excalibur calcium-binding domain-containing protein [Nocardioides pacificus]
MDQNITGPGARPESALEPEGGSHDSATAPFENCDAARAAGASPVRRADPGYGTHLDGDGDGIACE